MPQLDSAGTATNRREELLLEFLREFDAPCPTCGYNVKGLNRPFCPECNQELKLTIGVSRLRLGWLFVAVLPGFFAGIAGFFLAVPTVAISVEDGVIVWPFAAFTLFCWCSGLFAIVLAFRKRNRFIAQPRSRQRWIVLAIWLIHLIALGLFMVMFASVI